MSDRNVVLPAWPNIGWRNPTILGGGQWSLQTCPCAYTDENDPSHVAFSGIKVEDDGGALRKYTYAKLPSPISSTKFRGIAFDPTNLNDVYSDPGCSGRVEASVVYSALDLATLTWTNQSGLSIDTLNTKYLAFAAADAADDVTDGGHYTARLGFILPSGWGTGNTIFGVLLAWDANASPDLRRMTHASTNLYIISAS